MNRKSKSENRNTQVDKQGKVKCEEKDNLETQNQMEQVDETTRNIGIFLEDKMRRQRHFCSAGFNSNTCEYNIKDYLYAIFEVHDVSWQRNLTLSSITEALTDANVIIIGVHGTDSDEKAKILEKVSRRANKDKLFDMIVMANVTKKPNLKRIQEEIAYAFDLTMEEKNIEKRANRLEDRIKMEQKILIVLQDLCKGLDLNKLGIPFAANHTGCKILLTSTCEEILSNQMHAHKVFMA